MFRTVGGSVVTIPGRACAVLPEVPAKAVVKTLTWSVGELALEVLTQCEISPISVVVKLLNCRPG